MKKLDVGQTVAILANVGVIAGIVFLAVEIRQNNELLEVQVDMARADTQANSIPADVVAQPELIELMLKDETSLTDVERLRLATLGLRVLRIWQGRHRLMERGLVDFGDAARDMKNMYSRDELHYGIRLAWREFKGDFPPGFVAFMDENVVDER